MDPVNKEPNKEKGLPVYLKECQESPCAAWICRHPKRNTPERHFHCEHPLCHSKGLFLEGVPFACAHPAEAARHAAAHLNMEEKHQSELLQVWRFVVGRSGTLNRTDRTEHMSPFRTSMSTLEMEPTAESDKWRTRLYVGKMGTTGKALSATIENIGTLPLHGPALLQRHVHDPRTQVPLVGHTITFNQTEEGEATWYGVCCSPFTEQNVFGERGLACTVRWFDHSHTGPWGGQEARWYELTSLRQVQLLEWMHDWGDLLLHDAESGLFVEVDEDQNGTRNTKSLRPNWYDEEVRAPEEPESSAASKEELTLTGLIFPTRLLYFVDENGKACMPSSCSNVSRDSTSHRNCKWDTPFAREFLHLPVLTTGGPVFLRPIRYFCTVHHKSVTAGSRHRGCGPKRSHADNDDVEEDKTTNPYSLSMPYYRLGDIRYQPELLTELQSCYVDSLNVAFCRRRILDRWMSSALHYVTKLKLRALRTGLAAQKLQRSSRIMLALPDFLPSEHTLTKVLLLLYQKLVRPQIPAYDAAVAAFDGQLIRVDGTFKAANTILMSEVEPAPSAATKSKSRKRIYRKVGSCVLVYVGLEGLMLANPRLAPSENSRSIKDGLVYIMRGRRSLLGSLSCPSAFCSDSLRTQHSSFVTAASEVYPEITDELEHPGDESLESHALLMLQDIVHRQWVFTKKIASPKTHPDYPDYTRAIKDVFHRLRLPHRDVRVDGHNAVVEWETKCFELCESKVRTNQKKDIDDHVRIGILRGDRSSDLDDFVTAKALTCLGSEAMCKSGIGEYIPRTVLVRTGRRLMIEGRVLDRLFECNGYESGEDFLHHLEGVNVFYKQLRSPATKFSDQTVARELGRPVRPTKKQRVRLAEDDEELRSFDYGISDKGALVEEALTNIAHHVVVK